MKKICIGKKFIGEGYPCFTIAEAGANHEGDIKKAFQLIDEAKNSGVDAIKFQTYTAAKLTTKTAPKYWDDGIKNESQFDVFSKLDKLSDNEWKEVFDYAKNKKIICFSTPFDEESVDMLNSLNVPAFKIASADITHLPLIRKIASKKKPVFISTGMSTMEQIHDAIKIFQGFDCPFELQHSNSSYPMKPEEANLKCIQTLKEKFHCNVGYSGHESMGYLICVSAVLLGATSIERHITLDRSMYGSDQAASLEPQGLERLVRDIRTIDKILGDGVKRVWPSEIPVMNKLRNMI